jgi:hypothetical protein
MTAMERLWSMVNPTQRLERTRHTPELLHKPGATSRLHVLPLRFKKDMWNTPILRSTVQTKSGVYTYPTRPMLYRTANNTLKRLR